MPEEVNPASQGGVSLLDAANGLLNQPEAQNEDEQAVEQPEGAPEPTPAEPEQVAEETPAAEDELVIEEAEGEDLPPIRAPAHWKSDDKALFAQLPREHQQVLVDRERTRDGKVDQALREAAEAKKAADAAKEQAAAERQRYQQQMDQFLPGLQSRLQTEFSDIKTQADVLKLADEDPDRYSKWSALQDSLRMAQYEQAKLAEQQRTEQESAQREYLQKADERLREAFPEWAKDEVRGRKEIAEIHDYLADSYDVPRNVLGAMIEPWHYLIVQKAMKYDAAVARAKGAKLKNVPKVQQPGSGKTGKADDRAARLNNLGKSEDPLMDGARLLLS